MSKNNGTQDISWKKLVIAKSNNEWTTSAKASSVQQKQHNNVNGQREENANSEGDGSEECGIFPISFVQVEEYTPVEIKRRRRSPATDRQRKSVTPVPETNYERSSRLARMSAYAANRLANETPEQRAQRLRRMSEYAAKRLARETPEQRERRLSRMSAYSAKRLAGETAEQRALRLARMSAYAARRQAMKKIVDGTVDDYPRRRKLIECTTAATPNTNNDSNKSVTDQCMETKIY